MSFEVFKNKIISLIDRAGGGILVDFSTDQENGRHIACCSDGTKIVGNSVCARLSVQWGSGHRAFATI